MKKKSKKSKKSKKKDVKISKKKSKGSIKMIKNFGYKIVNRVPDGSKKTIYFFDSKGSRLIFRDAIKILGSERFPGPELRNLVTSILKRIPYTFMWKITAMNSNRKEPDYTRKDKYFQMSVVKSHFHHHKQDSEKFNEYLSKEHPGHEFKSKNFVFFNSPSGNGLLIPRNIDKDSESKNTYMHFSNFIKMAPKNQVDEFWILFSNILDKILSSSSEKKRIYINTHGHAVPWLHIRFDKEPNNINQW